VELSEQVTTPTIWICNTNNETIKICSSCKQFFYSTLLYWWWAGAVKFCMHVCIVLIQATRLIRKQQISTSRQMDRQTKANYICKLQA